MLFFYLNFGSLLITSYIVNAVPHHYELDNGLTVVLLNDPQTKVSSARVLVRSGALHEGRFLGSGVSHYLEHLVSGGTTFYQSEKYYRNVFNQLEGLLMLTQLMIIRRISILKTNALK